MSKDNNKLNICLDNSQTGKSFVGLTSENGILKVIFPMGYHLEKTGILDISDEILKDISNLIRILKQGQEDGIIPFDEGENLAFPIYEYMYVIEYYISHNLTYYKETESLYEIRDSGRISWNKTIKNTTPIVANNKIVYLDLMRKHNGFDDDNLITTINKYCVYEALELLGPLYDGLHVLGPLEKPGENKSLWITFLRDKINHTNNDDKKRLFRSMLSILSNEGSDDDAHHFSFATSSFESIWEEMIRVVYGNVDNIEKFYPRPKWELIYQGQAEAKNSNALRPDAVFINNHEDVIVIDAKYYSFGVKDETENIYDLPGSPDINKQFTYTDYAYYKFHDVYKGKYLSTFMIPYDGFADESIKYIGKAICDWYENKYNLYAYLIDTKGLINDYIKRNKHNLGKSIQMINNT